MDSQEVAIEDARRLCPDEGDIHGDEGVVVNGSFTQESGEFHGGGNDSLNERLFYVRGIRTC